VLFVVEHIRLVFWLEDIGETNETIMESVCTKEVYMTEGQWHSWDGHALEVILRFVYLDVRQF
jgi:hypothetical protein